MFDEWIVAHFLLNKRAIFCNIYSIGAWPNWSAKFFTFIFFSWTLRTTNRKIDKFLPAYTLFFHFATIPQISRMHKLGRLVLKVIVLWWLLSLKKGINFRWLLIASIEFCKSLNIWNARLQCIFEIQSQFICDYVQQN